MIPFPVSPKGEKPASNLAPSPVGEGWEGGKK